MARGQGVLASVQQGMKLCIDCPNRRRDRKRNHDGGNDRKDGAAGVAGKFPRPSGPG